MMNRRGRTVPVDWIRLRRKSRFGNKTVFRISVIPRMTPSIVPMKETLSYPTCCFKILSVTSLAYIMFSFNFTYYFEGEQENIQEVKGS
jgi:hypothetical protein